MINMYFNVFVSVLRYGFLSIFWLFAQITLAIFLFPFPGTQRDILKKIKSFYIKERNEIIFHQSFSKKIFPYRSYLDPALEKNCIQTVPSETTALKPIVYWGETTQMTLKGNKFQTKETVTLRLKNISIFSELLGVIHQGNLYSPLTSKPSPQCFEVYNYRKNILRDENHIFWLDHFAKNIFLKIRHPFKKIKKQPPILVEKLIYATNQIGYVDNYFHFIVDVLPSYIQSMESVKKSDRESWKIGIAESPHKNITDTIKSVAAYYGFNDFFELNKNQIVDCQDVISTSYPSYIWDDLPEDNFSYSRELLLKTAEVLKKISVEKLSEFNDLNSEIVYITRRKQVKSSLTPTRCTLNAEELATCIQTEFSGKVVETSDLTNALQQAIFSKAKIIIVDAGATLANVVYAGPDQHIVILTQPDYNDASIFAPMIQCFTKNVYFVFGETKTEYGLDRWHSPYIVDAEEFKKCIRGILEGDFQSRAGVIA